MTLLEAIVIAVLVAGLGFHLVAAVGVLRLPDFYTRLHALSKADTLGTLLALVAIALWEGVSLTAVKVVLIAVFLFLSNPVAAHAMARAAFRAARPSATDEGERAP